MKKGSWLEDEEEDEEGWRQQEESIVLEIVLFLVCIGRLSRRFSDGGKDAPWLRCTSEKDGIIFLLSLQYSDTLPK